MRAGGQVELGTGDSPFGLPDEDLWRRLCALLDNDDLEEVFQEFIVPVRRFE